MAQNNTQEIKTFGSYTEIQKQIYIPSMQRSIIELHVSEMLDHIRRQVGRRCAPIFGSIDLVNLSGNLYVVDGQHRMRALQRAYDEFQIMVSFHAVIYYVKTQDEMEEIFRLRNKGIPVPDYIKNLGNNKIALLKEIESYIVRIPLFVTGSKNRPHINVTAFMDSLNKSKLLTIINSTDEFKHAFDFINSGMKIKYSDSSNRRGLVSEVMWSTVNRNGIFLGLDKNMVWFGQDYDIHNINAYITLMRKDDLIKI